MEVNKISPCLWFNDNAEEAVNFYISVFKNARIKDMVPYGATNPNGKTGSVMLITFEIEGQEFMALNGGPQFQFCPAISLRINCDTQREIDTLWEKLSEGGKPGECGWLVDKFGVSWQVMPSIIADMLKDEVAAKRDKVIDALHSMQKLDIDKIKEAYEG